MKALLKLIALMALFMSHVSFALDREIIATYNRKVVEQICGGSGDWLRCYGIDPLTCERVNGAIVEGCTQEHIFRRSEPVRSESDVQAVSDQLHNCIVTTFRAKYGAQKKNSPECQGIF